MPRSLLFFLYEEGCKVTKDKLSIGQEQVTFLGHCISAGAKHLTKDRREGILQVKTPSTPRQLRAFLGLVGYCREWIPNASSLLDPLYSALKREEKGKILLTEEEQKAFEQIKDTVTRAPALGLPQYDRSFTLFCHEYEGYAHGVLTQEHGGKQRPLGYYSQKLDSVIRGSPSCVRAVAAAAVLKDKTSDLVLDHPLIIQVPHSVTEILNQARTKHLSTARLTKYEVALLSPSNVTIKRCTVLNPATLLPQVEVSKEGSIGKEEESESSDDPDRENPPSKISHDCLELMRSETQGNGKRGGPHVRMAYGQMQRNAAYLELCIQ